MHGRVDCPCADGYLKCRCLKKVELEARSRTEEEIAVAYAILTEFDGTLHSNSSDSGAANWRITLQIEDNTIKPFGETPEGAGEEDDDEDDDTDLRDASAATEVCVGSDSHEMEMLTAMLLQGLGRGKGGVREAVFDRKEDHVHVYDQGRTGL